MKTFVWTFLIILVFESLGRIIWLVEGVFPQKTSTTVAVDLIASICFICWAIWLIASAP